jgi:type IX secretion system PorP/SprF family membrane protein
MKKIVYLLLIFASLKGVAQDLHYSHFMQAPLQRGASEAGNFDGDLRLTALQRRQWSSVTTPYRSLSFAGDGKLSALHSGLKGLNAGIQINYDRAGDGDLTALQLLLSVSYKIALNSDSAHFLRVGMQGGIVQRSIDFNALTFDNQFDGDVFNPQSLSGETFGENSFSTGDWGIGIGWTGIGESGMLDAGFQVMHLNRSQWSLLESGSANYPLLYQFTIAAAGAGNEPLQWKPALTIMRQDQNTEITGGTELQFRLKERPIRAWAFSVAAFYRYRDAIIPQVALYYDKFRLGFSYDINVSGLREVSQARGGAEFSIVYIARRIRSQSKSSTVCPVY